MLIKQPDGLRTNIKTHRAHTHFGSLNLATQLHKVAPTKYKNLYCIFIFFWDSTKLSVNGCTSQLGLSLLRSAQALSHLEHLAVWPHKQYFWKVECRVTVTEKNSMLQYLTRLLKCASHLQYTTPVYQATYTGRKWHPSKRSAAAVCCEWPRLG